MLDRRQLRQWVDRFGVPERQVRRDHLISHVLASLPDIVPADTVFFGGTALCRTHLPGWRLSEDVDLLVEKVSTVSQQLTVALPQALRREFPDITVAWDRGGVTQSGTVGVADLQIRVHLAQTDASYRRYPVAELSVELRYADLPETVEMICPTAPGAAAMKLVAWSERKTPRDLCDLYGLASHGLLSAEALAITAEAARPVQRHDFEDDQVPSKEQWVAALGHQMLEPPARVAALAEVRATVGALAGWG